MWFDQWILFGWGHVGSSLQVIIEWMNWIFFLYMLEMTKNEWMDDDKGLKQVFLNRWNLIDQWILFGVGPYSVRFEMMLKRSTFFGVLVWIEMKYLGCLVVMFLWSPKFNIDIKSSRREDWWKLSDCVVDPNTSIS